MTEYTFDDFIHNGAQIVINAARKSEHAKVRVGNGYQAVIIDGGEYEMLQQSLKLCEEHPSWLEEK